MRREVSVSRVVRDMLGDRRAANCALRRGDARARLCAWAGLTSTATMREIVWAVTSEWDGTDSALHARGREIFG